MSKKFTKGILVTTPGFIHNGLTFTERVMGVIIDSYEEHNI